VHLSGEQVEIARGDQRAVVVEVGGGIRTYDVGGRPVLDGYGADELVTGARGQPLLPWPNRLHTGRYTWDGEEHEVPLDEPDQANALHGLAKWLRWQVEDHSGSSVTMRVLLPPQPAYPFALDVTVTYALDDGGLTVTTRATNVGDRDAPFGHGAHPYLAVEGALDDAVLHVPASTWLPTGPAQIPIGRDPVGGTPYDFRSPRPIGRVHVDHAFTDLDRDDAGRASVRLSWASGTTTLWLDDGYPYVELFTGDTLPSRQRQSLGVEPMTCPPDAFRTGEDVVRLTPGETVELRWGVTPG
jgi:aldose 1-epimerase